MSKIHANYLNVIMQDQMIRYNYFVTEKQQGELYVAQELLKYLSARANEFHEVLPSFKAKCYIYIFCIYSKDTKEYSIGVNLSLNQN